MFPKLSIITPSFNQGKFIEQTIQSVLSQNYPNLEYIVMDGGSTDNTVDILKKYQGRIHWKSEKDKGQADAINKGLRMATGDIVAYINSDDYYLPGTFKEVVSKFSNDETIDWVTGDYVIIDENGNQIQNAVQVYKRIFRSISSFSLLSILNFIPQPSTFWRRDFQNSIGLFDESLRYCMDYDMWMRMIQKNKPSLITSPLSAFRIHSRSKGGSQYAQQFQEELQVEKRYNTNQFLHVLHLLHVNLITSIYGMVKGKIE